MEKLIDELKAKYNFSDDFFDGVYQVYPFNRLEYAMSYLLGTGRITFDEYLDIRGRYLERNKYLYLFEITAPRSFGETWAQNHLNQLVPELQKPSAVLDPEYSGQYDFWYQGIRIEVKASRAVRRESGSSLIMKALSSDSECRFDMNFQQIKPSCCDVFVWIGVWRDVIRYWVLSSYEVMTNRYYSSGNNQKRTLKSLLMLELHGRHNLIHY